MVGSGKYLCPMSTAAALEKKENHSRLLHWKNVTNRRPYRPHILLLLCPWPPPAEFLIVSIHAMYIYICIPARTERAVESSPPHLCRLWLGLSRSHSPYIISMPEMNHNVHCVSMMMGEENWNKDAVAGWGWSLSTSTSSSSSPLVYT